MRKEVIGRATLYLGDCREVLPTLPKVDAVVTDPPYGLGTRLHREADDVWKLRSTADAEWDSEPAYEALELALCASLWHIVWGGNYYVLPPARCWLLWDKMQEHSGAHAEMAWTNLDKPVRTFRYARAQLASEGKVHPTQKPEPLMRWCIGHLPHDSDTILDPFMGSGTTGVAAVQMGRDFIGIEREERYFEIACRRIEEAQRQGDLFLGDAA
jgi:site-specific DNA-methyltransferase (adenine-specific)